MAEELKGKLVSLNSTDPTKLRCTFVIHSLDDVSWNNQTISEETAIKHMYTICNAPIVGKYIPETKTGYGDDAFSDHCVEVEEQRLTGDLQIVTDTVALGVFTRPFIDTIDGQKCLCADGVLWRDKNPNAVSLIEEWNSRDIRVMTSCEYVYSSFTQREDGVQEVLNPHYTALCILNSEERGEHEIVMPAYDASCLISLNQAIKKDIEINNQEIKDGDKVEQEIKDEVVEVETQEEVVEETPETVEDVVESEEVVEPVEEAIETPAEEEVVEEEIEVQEEVKEEVEPQVDLNQRIQELETELATSKENEVTLNARIIELQEIETKYNELVFNEKLHEVEEEYKAKFDKVGLNEKFESEEVKELLVDVAKSMNEAKIKLADMILDAIQGEKAEIKPVMESMNSINKGKALIPTKTDTLTKWGFE